MTKLRGVITAVLLGAATIGASAPAQAQWRGDVHRWHDHDDWRWHRGYSRPGVLGAGLIGIAAGTLIAGGTPVYGYAPPAYYYGPPYPYRVPVCTLHRRWDAYWGRFVQVERCFR